ncbi:hypothetical protein HanRHA438_Chr12g0540571 [Helianthus annuus]|nr:hypothetical protein HanRHA438_Chr12g0540571 [Helianthus annuus]
MRRWLMSDVPLLKVMKNEQFGGETGFECESESWKNKKIIKFHQGGAAVRLGPRRYT